MDLGIEEGVIRIPPYRKPVYKLDVTNVGTSDGSVSSPAMTLYKLNDWEDVSATSLSGSMSVSGQEITLKKIDGSTLEIGKRYLAVVTYTKDSSEEGNEIAIECGYEEPNVP